MVERRMCNALVWIFHEEIVLRVVVVVVVVVVVERVGGGGGGHCRTMCKWAAQMQTPDHQCALNTDTTYCRCRNWRVSDAGSAPWGTFAHRYTEQALLFRWGWVSGLFPYVALLHSPSV